MVAAISGDVTHFKGARNCANWLGLTPHEFSSGASPRKATATCACRSRAGRAACSERPALRSRRARPWVACGTGRCTSRRARITTTRPARWPTSWRASATPRCAPTQHSTRKCTSYRHGTSQIPKQILDIRLQVVLSTGANRSGLSRCGKSIYEGLSVNEKPAHAEGGQSEFVVCTEESLPALYRRLRS